MAKYIQRKDGTMAGSIGDGKTRVPTAGSVAPSVGGAAAAPHSPGESLDAMFERFAASVKANPISDFERFATSLGVHVVDASTLEFCKDGLIAIYNPDTAATSAFNQHGGLVDIDPAGNSFRARSVWRGKPVHPTRLIGMYATPEEAVAAAREEVLTAYREELAMQPHRVISRAEQFGRRGYPDNSLVVDRAELRRESDGRPGLRYVLAQTPNSVRRFSLLSEKYATATATGSGSFRLRVEAVSGQTLTPVDEFEVTSLDGVIPLLQRQYNAL
jgi:hypothetical protein